MNMPKYSYKLMPSKMKDETKVSELGTHAIHVKIGHGKTVHICWAWCKQIGNTLYVHTTKEVLCKKKVTDSFGLRTSYTPYNEEPTCKACIKIQTISTDKQ